jgi:hypothetical protein
MVESLASGKVAHERCILLQSARASERAGGLRSWGGVARETSSSPPNGEVPSDRLRLAPHSRQERFLELLDADLLKSTIRLPRSSGPRSARSLAAESSIQSGAIRNDNVWRMPDRVTTPGFRPFMAAVCMFWKELVQLVSDVRRE